MKKSILISVLAVAVLFGVVGYATAGNNTFPGAPNGSGDQEATGSTTVKASVNPKITLEITTPDGAGNTLDVDFGTVDPGAVIPAKTVNLLVDSNKAFSVESTQSVAGFGGISLARNLADIASVAKGANVPFSDTYTISVPWTTDPGNYTATVQYTVTQN